MTTTTMTSRAKIHDYTATVVWDGNRGEGTATYAGYDRDYRALIEREGGPAPTETGRAFFAGFGIDLAALERARRPLCRLCLDWSERRHHLAGALGAAILRHVLEQGWARQDEAGRAVRFTPRGERLFADAFPVVRGAA
jgi:hypothetical protein